MSAVSGSSSGIKKRYYDMTFTRLTVNTLLYFGLWYQLILEMFWRPFRYQGHGLCGFRKGTVSETQTRHHLAIDEPSVGSIRVPDRDAVVERNEEGIRIPVEGRMKSIVCTQNR